MLRSSSNYIVQRTVLNRFTDHCIVLIKSRSVLCVGSDTRGKVMILLVAEEYKHHVTLSSKSSSVLMYMTSYVHLDTPQHELVKPA